MRWGKIVRDISSRKAAADEIVAWRNELRFLYDWLQHVRKDERIALAREVHDQLGQILSAAKIDIKLLLEDIQASRAGLPRRTLVAELNSASDTLDQAIGSARSIAVQLRPPEIDSQGCFRQSPGMRATSSGVPACGSNLTCPRHHRDDLRAAARPARSAACAR